MTFLVLAVFTPWAIARTTLRERQAATADSERAALAAEAELTRQQWETMVRHHRHATRLHDNIGHDLALLAISASRVEVDERLPADARDLGRQIRQLAANSTAQLADAIAVLSDDEIVGADEVGSVDDIVEQARSAGMAVHYSFAEASGLTGGDTAMSVVVVRELLTNAAKHAPGQEVWIDGRVDGAEIVISSRNDVQVSSVEPIVGGTGLRSLRAVLGARAGSLVVDQATNFTVTARWRR